LLGRSEKHLAGDGVTAALTIGGYGGFNCQQLADFIGKKQRTE